MQDSQQTRPLEDVGLNGRIGLNIKMRYRIRLRSNDKDKPSDYINYK
jgi:hypothetical protein